MKAHVSGFVHGWGIQDAPTRKDGRPVKFYSLWASMLHRVLDKKFHRKQPTYKGCSIDASWQRYSVFENWCSRNGYVDGHQLDKDILVQGNKVYGPKTCCFVPRELNMLLVVQQRSLGTLPCGIRRHYNKFTAQLRIKGKHVHLGMFDTAEQAHYAYRKAKAAHIKTLAHAYFVAGLITPKVHRALKRLANTMLNQPAHTSKKRSRI